MISEAIHSNAAPVRKVGRYRILSELGRGGMATVYLAVTHGPGGVHKLVVLKALLPELAAEPGALTMFLDEARLAAQLNHANVVQTYEVGTEGDRHVIVMEYLEGQALSTILRRGQAIGQPLPIAMHLRIISAVLEGLQYAHELSAYDGSPLTLVHRDVSPQNVFVTYDGQVKVLDFGIAKASSSSTNTATGVVKGKIAYMAPEQMVAEGVDRRADVYSVGCMLWALATGRKLWKDTSDVQILRAVLHGEVAPPRSVNPECDEELDRIVMKALAAHREHRYQSALELQDDLERYCDARAIPTRQKQIGEYVAGLFSNTRAELKALVERQLHLVADDSAPLPAASAVLQEGTQTRRADGSDSFPRSIGGSSTADVSVEVPAVPQKRRRLLGYTALAVSVVLIALVLWASRGPRSAEAQGTTRAHELETVAGVQAPAALQATLELRAVPASAALFLDGERLDANPVSRRLPVDGREHQLRAEAEGHQPGSRSFVATKDEAIEISLEKAPAPSQPSSRPQQAKPRPRTAAASPVRKPPAVDCKTPFFFDSDGIKKIRPGCL